MKPPGGLGTDAAQLFGVSLLFQGGKRLCFDQVSSVYGKSLSGEAPFMYFSGSLWVRGVEGTGTLFVPKGRSSRAQGSHTPHTKAKGRRSHRL